MSSSSLCVEIIGKDSEAKERERSEDQSEMATGRFRYTVWMRKNWSWKKTSENRRNFNWSLAFLFLLSPLSSAFRIAFLSNRSDHYDVMWGIKREEEDKLTSIVRNRNRTSTAASAAARWEHRKMIEISKDFVYLMIFRLFVCASCSLSSDDVMSLMLPISL